MNGYGIAVAEKKESFKLGIVIIKEMEMARFIWELNISGKRSYCCLPPRKIMAVFSAGRICKRYNILWRIGVPQLILVRTL